MNSKFKKFIALSVIIAFTPSNYVFAVGKGAKEDKKDIRDILEINIPENFGSVKEKFWGPSDKVIIHFQDSHCNFEAQSNFASILKYLKASQFKDYLKLITVEGATGGIDLSPFDVVKKDSIKEAIASYFMRNGFLTGSEYYALFDKKPMDIYGIEDEKLYIENYTYFLKTQYYKKEAAKYLEEINGAVNLLRPKVFGPEMLAISLKESDFDDWKISFTEYCSYLKDTAGKFGVDFRRFDNFFRVIETIALGEPDTAAVNKERTDFVAALQKKMDKEDAAELVKKTLYLRIGRISSGDFYSYLLEVAQKVKFDTSKYVELMRYIKIVKLNEKLNPAELFKDVDMLLAEIKGKAFRNDDERDLDRLLKDVRITEKLFNLELTREDLPYFKEHKSEIDGKKFLSRINGLTAKYGLPDKLPSEVAAVTDHLSEMEGFYEAALKRDDAIVDNTLAEMEKKGVRTAVMVTGGFHSTGVIDRLRKKGISYLVVTPRMADKYDPSVYMARMLNEEPPLEKFLKSSGSYLNAIDPWGPGYKFVIFENGKLIASIDTTEKSYFKDLVITKLDFMNYLETANYRMAVGLAKGAGKDGIIHKELMTVISDYILKQLEPAITKHAAKEKVIRSLTELIKMLGKENYMNLTPGLGEFFVDIAELKKPGPITAPTAAPAPSVTVDTIVNYVKEFLDDTSYVLLDMLNSLEMNQLAAMVEVPVEGTVGAASPYYLLAPEIQELKSAIGTNVPDRPERVEKCLNNLLDEKHSTLFEAGLYQRNFSIGLAALMKEGEVARARELASRMRDAADKVREIAAAEKVQPSRLARVVPAARPFEDIRGIFQSKLIGAAENMDSTVRSVTIPGTQREIRYKLLTYNTDDFKDETIRKMLESLGGSYRMTAAEVKKWKTGVAENYIFVRKGTDVGRNMVAEEFEAFQLYYRELLAEKKLAIRDQLKEIGGGVDDKAIEDGIVKGARVLAWFKQIGLAGWNDQERKAYFAQQFGNIEGLKLFDDIGRYNDLFNKAEQITPETLAAGTFYADLSGYVREKRPELLAAAREKAITPEQKAKAEEKKISESEDVAFLLDVVKKDKEHALAARKALFNVLIRRLAALDNNLYSFSTSDEKFDALALFLFGQRDIIEAVMDKKFDTDYKEEIKYTTLKEGAIYRWRKTVNPVVYQLQLGRILTAVKDRLDRGEAIKNAIESMISDDAKLNNKIDLLMDRFGKVSGKEDGKEIADYLSRVISFLNLILNLKEADQAMVKALVERVLANALGPDGIVLSAGEVENPAPLLKELRELFVKLNENEEISKEYKVRFGIRVAVLCKEAEEADQAQKIITSIEKVPEIRDGVDVIGAEELIKLEHHTINGLISLSKAINELFDKNDYTRPGFPLAAWKVIKKVNELPPAATIDDEIAQVRGINRTQFELALQKREIDTQQLSIVDKTIAVIDEYWGRFSALAFGSSLRSIGPDDDVADPKLDEDLLALIKENKITPEKSTVEGKTVYQIAFRKNDPILTRLKESNKYAYNTRIGDEYFKFVPIPNEDMDNGFTAEHEDLEVLIKIKWGVNDPKEVHRQAFMAQIALRGWEDVSSSSFIKAQLEEMGKNGQIAELNYIIGQDRESHRKLRDSDLFRELVTALARDRNIPEAEIEMRIKNIDKFEGSVNAMAREVLGSIGPTEIIGKTPLENPIGTIKRSFDAALDDA